MGFSLGDFKAAEYGVEYVSLRQGAIVHIALDVAEDQGYSYGRNELGEEGWFPMTFVDLASEGPSNTNAVMLHSECVSRQDDQVLQTSWQSKESLPGNDHMPAQDFGRGFHDAQGGMKRFQEVSVDLVDYRQPSCSDHFRDGRDIEETIQGLNEGSIDPLHPPFEPLQVIKLTREK